MATWKGIEPHPPDFTAPHRPVRLGSDLTTLRPLHLRRVDSARASGEHVMVAWAGYEPTHARSYPLITGTLPARGSEANGAPSEKQASAVCQPSG